jgi:hypothetical protein
MKNRLFPSLLLIAAALAATPAAAQVRNNPLTSLARPTMPRIANPGVSLSAPATSPLQAQEQDNFATQLRAEQFQLQQQNPGITRPAIGINNALNGFTPH